MSARRIICHWTAGAQQPSADDVKHYHYLVAHMHGDTDEPDDDWAKLVVGVPVARNMRSLSGQPSFTRDPNRGYAAHTRGFNSWSIGVALCGMRGAQDFRDPRRASGGVHPGPAPITTLQIESLIGLLVTLGAEHGLSPVKDQMFTHYEAQSLHGKPQRGKWNITWLPHRPDMPADDVGPWLREQVQRMIAGKRLDLPDYWTDDGCFD